MATGTALKDTKEVNVGARDFVVNCIQKKEAISFCLGNK